jgi:hypothetical protein
MSVENYPITDQEVSQKTAMAWGRRTLALTGMVSALGGGLAGEAKGMELTSSAASPAALSAEFAPKNITESPIRPNLKYALASIKGAIEKANKCKDPNVFYGAIFIKHTESPDHRVNIVYGSADKTPRGRMEVPMGYSLLLVDPVIEYYNGREYAIVSDRGKVDRMDNTMKDAAVTKGVSLLDYQYRFIDLKEAESVNKGRDKMKYYSHGSTRPKMVRSTVRDEHRYLANGVPQYNPVGTMAYSFYSQSYDPNSFNNYVINHGLVPVPNYQLPPVKH